MTKPQQPIITPRDHFRNVGWGQPPAVSVVKTEETPQTPHQRASAQITKSLRQDKS